MKELEEKNEEERGVEMYSNCLYGESYEENSTGCHIVDERNEQIAKLQQKIDKASKLLNANTHTANIYQALCNLLLDNDYKYEIDNDELSEILKGEQE